MEANAGGQGWRRGLQVTKDACTVQVVLVLIDTGNPEAPGVLVELDEGLPFGQGCGACSNTLSHTETQEPQDLSNCIRLQ